MRVEPAEELVARFELAVVDPEEEVVALADRLVGEAAEPFREGLMNMPRELAARGDASESLLLDAGKRLRLSFGGRDAHKKKANQLKNVDAGLRKENANAKKYAAVSATSASATSP